MLNNALPQTFTLRFYFFYLSGAWDSWLFKYLCFLGGKTPKESKLITFLRINYYLTIIMMDAKVFIHCFHCISLSCASGFINIIHMTNLLSRPSLLTVVITCGKMKYLHSWTFWYPDVFVWLIVVLFVISIKDLLQGLRLVCRDCILLYQWDIKLHKKGE